MENKLNTDLSRAAALLTALSLLCGTILALLLAPPLALGHEDAHSVGGDKLVITDPAGKVHKRKFLFKARDQLSINEFGEDLRLVGSSIIVRGSGQYDGNTGVVYLDPAGWTPIGKMPDPRGWKYRGDHGSNASSGVTKVLIKGGRNGGKLIIKGKGRYWGYDVLAAQASVEIGLTLGDEQYCAEYSSFDRNEIGKVQGKNASVPLACNAVCGNDKVELGETCDDGNAVDDDTCTTLCEIGCEVSDVEYDSTYEALQGLIFDSATYQCSNDLCHGVALAGGLDLRAGASHAALLGVASLADPATVRVFPGDQDLSMLYLKMAAKTLGPPYAPPGSPMPTNPETVDAGLLEALRLWIRGGAPETGVVVDTAELLDACLPPPSPNKTPQPDPPAFGSGIQLALPGFPVQPNDEDEACVPTYYDLTAPGVVPAEFRVPCPGEFPATNETGDSPGECFSYNRQSFAMDAQSHHLILHIYKGVYDWDDAGWGQWSCYLGDNHGLACDPTTPDPCPGGGVCGGESVGGFACIGTFGPDDYGFGPANAPQIGGIQEPTTTNEFGTGVYSVLPLKGLVVWNTHRFNLTDEVANVEGWVNVDFTSDRQYQAAGMFDTTYIFSQEVPPFEQREYCATHTFTENTHLTDINSHTHYWGKYFRIYGPPQTPCPKGVRDPYNFFWMTDPACVPGSQADMFYESFDYTDPLQLDIDPPMVFSGSVADRTIKFCALFDNGASNPVEVKTHSGSPQPPVPGMPGGPCNWDETYCIGGPNEGDLCYLNDQLCPLGVCDACMLKGGVTAGDEMFIPFGNFYIP